MPKPRTAAVVTTTARVEVKLQPQLRTTLAPLVTTVQQNNAEIKRLKKENKENYTKIEKAFKDAKQVKALMAGVEVDGVPVKMVCGTQRKLDKTLLIELGCDPDWIEEATEEKPKKPYISVGKAADEEDE